MDAALKTGVIINILDFGHPHVQSLRSERLWGFPDDKHGINRRRWSALQAGMPVLFYGDFGGTKGIFLRASLERKVESSAPVRYWVRNPTGYPLHIFVRIESEKDLSKVQPVRKEELAMSFSVPIFRQKADRWSLVVFGGKGPGVTYPIGKFLAVLSEFDVRNRLVVVERPDHEGLKDILYQMGVIQRRVSEKEVKVNGYRIDVGWRKIPRGDPYIAFEVQLSGNLEEALTKLKHAYDTWNAKPVLVTTEKQIDEATRIIEGSFHEIRDTIRVIDWREIKQAYEVKSKYKQLEAKLGIF